MKYEDVAVTDNPILAAKSMKTRTLVVRLGAYGDCIIITPLLKILAQNFNNEIYVLTSEQGMEILENNPHIDRLIYYPRNSIPNELFGEFLETTRKAYDCDRIIDLCESIEVALALRYEDPRYNYTKNERRVICDKNYYDYTLDFAGYSEPELKGQHGELFFTVDEERWAKEEAGRVWGGKYGILWGLSGSGRNKAYPFVNYVWGSLITKYPNLVIMSVGDPVCEILECGTQHPALVGKSGKYTFRQSALLAKYADLVVSPDTGLLHVAGCYDTPKIGLLGHTTKNNITATFKNDHSIEAKCECAPCFRLIYNAGSQCPMDFVINAPWCMSKGLPAEMVYKHISDIIDKDYYGGKRNQNRIGK